MAGCWSRRGCDDEMQATCPHASVETERCPAECYFSKCDRPTHHVTADPALIFTPESDRDQAKRDTCLYCEFFLTRGPRLS